MGDLHILNGPDMGRRFVLKEGANFIGRSSENDIQIRDDTISRQHLRIVKKQRTYFLSDLGSHNGTFFNGNYLAPGNEVEIKEGVPIVIGMTIVGVCDEASRSKLPLFDSMGLTTETASNSGFFALHKAKTNQKKLELIYKITDLLQQSLSKEDCLEMLLDIFFEFMVRIDRAAFILVDRQTGAITTSLSKRMKSDDKTLLSYSKEVVARVIRESKRLIISDALQEEAESELMNALAKENIASVMCLPLISFSMLVGALYVDCLKRPYPFALEDISLFEDIAQRTATYLLYKDIAPG